MSDWIGPCVHGRDPWARCDVCGNIAAEDAKLWAEHPGWFCAHGVRNDDDNCGACTSSDISYWIRSTNRVEEWLADSHDEIAALRAERDEALEALRRLQDCCAPPAACCNECAAILARYPTPSGKAK